MRMSQIEITQKKSTIGEPKKIRGVIASLGLRKIGDTVRQKDNNCIRGNINKVKHLVNFRCLEKNA